MAAWVRKIRLGAKLSQAEFGARLRAEPHVSPVTVSKWETGEQRIETNSIGLIRKAFPESPPPPLPGMSDPPAISGVSDDTDNATGDYNVTTAEGQTVGRELDEIEDGPLRKRARNAALAAIESEMAKPRPRVPGAGKSGSASRHS